jgi:hypothetical protein
VSIRRQGLHEHVHRLLHSVDLGELISTIVSTCEIQEVKIFVVNMLGPGLHLRHGCNDKGSIVVFKELTMDILVATTDRKAQVLHLL